MDFIPKTGIFSNSCSLFGRYYPIELLKIPVHVHLAKPCLFKQCPDRFRLFFANFHRQHTAWL